MARLLDAEILVLEAIREAIELGDGAATEFSFLRGFTRDLELDGECWEAPRK